MRRCDLWSGALPGNQRGFTLLELLVTLVVLGLLMATLTQAIRLGMAARRMELRIESSVTELETTARVLRRLIAQISPGDPSAPEGSFIGTPHAASFVTILPVPHGAIATREADVSLGIADGHRLVLRWRPHYRRWIVPPPPPSTELLLDGVARLDLGFWRPGPGLGGGTWVSDWSAPDPPELVRLHLVFADDDPRHWPDIIAAPMRARP